MTIREPAPRGELVQERGASFEVFALPIDEETVLNVLNDCFDEWRHIRFDPAAPHGATMEGGFGLGGMEQRAESLGGCLTVRSEKGKGTLVEVRVPR